jgi:hypothetical protein
MDDDEQIDRQAQTSSRKDNLRSRPKRQQQQLAANKTSARQELVTSDITTSCDDHSLPSLAFGADSGQQHGWQELSRV